MGRIKTTFVKRKTKELHKKHGVKFTEDFEGNKRKVDDLVKVQSKKIRNIIAGYMTRLKKQEE